MNNKKKILLCGIILIIVDILIITVIGRTYTFKEDRTRYEIQENQTEFEVKFEKENIAKVIKKELTNNEVIVKIKGLKEGKTVIFINDKIDVIYVHPLGIITVNSGDALKLYSCRPGRFAAADREIVRVRDFGNIAHAPERYPNHIWLGTMRVDMPDRFVALRQRQTAEDTVNFFGGDGITYRLFMLKTQEMVSWKIQQFCQSAGRYR